ncbi:MAG TPA: diguanylate cyclase [Rhodocyclaceae bacterium]|jgi:diguanylate cyclase (GGDEF)-like protein/PAS domain S-box-containing protein
MNKTLLLVDDEPALLHSLQRLFRNEGYALLTAGSGEEALQLLETQVAQVIISDQRMPGISGVEFLARAKVLYPDSVRLILSGYADIEVITDSINKGSVYKFLHKPWDNTLLLENVRDAFHHFSLVQQSAQFAKIYENTVEAIFITDAQGNIQAANPAFRTITGYDPEEVLGLPPVILSQLLDREDYFQDIKLALSTTNNWTGEVWSRRKNGEVFPAWINVSVIQDGAGKASQYVGLFKDISERKQKEIALRESEKRFRDFMEFAPIGMVIVSLDGHFLKVNQALCEILGYDRQALEKLTFEDITHPDEIAADLANRRRLMTGELPVLQQERRYLRLDGRIVWAQLTASLLRDTKGIPQCFDVQMEDITERKRNQDQIRQLAYYDTLTNLPNRRLLQDRLSQVLSQAKRNEKMIAVIFLDLDRFKQINDTYGHDIGDELLKAVAAVLNACVRSGDTVSRQGGDEFIIVLSEISQAQGAVLVAEKILKALVQPIVLGNLQLTITTSLGIAIFPDHGTDVQSLMKNADTAMYAAKDGGRNQYRLYSADMGQESD